MFSSALLELLHQTNYVEELKHLAHLDIDALSDDELVDAERLLSEAFTEINRALLLDWANGIEFENDFTKGVTRTSAALCGRIADVEERQEGIIGPFVED